ncbi:transcriptional regulator [Streptomyces albidoflavus]
MRTRRRARWYRIRGERRGLVPRNRRWALPDTVHQRVRLGILAITREADRVEFSFLKKELAVTDGNLSRHLKVLESAALVTLEKGYPGRRPRTWITLTREGGQAHGAHPSVRSRPPGTWGSPPYARGASGGRPPPGRPPGLTPVCTGRMHP